MPLKPTHPLPARRTTLAAPAWTRCAGVLERARAQGSAANTAPDVYRRLENEGCVGVGNAPEAFSRSVQAEITRWSRVVKFSGATPE